MDNSIPSQSTNSLEQKVTGFLERKPVIYQFLRFACIGLLNTALSFLVQNSISKYFNISQGPKFGVIQGIAFVCAVIQSYPWNRTWTFGSETGVTLWQNFKRLISVGALGAVALIIAFVASGLQAPFWFFVIILVIYLLTEELLWKYFGFHMSDWDHVGHSFLIFFVVTSVGLLINASLSAVISSNLHLTNPDLDKNIAAALATGVSLFWNFTGYKVVVFKK